ncbi:hypothetical protein AYO38_03925 [bacterium SCGC AG-212-C10]|nr:hypothetical protein AYO38_03925 [bacterium SCGC AG-212-C10]
MITAETEDDVRRLLKLPEGSDFSHAATSGGLEGSDVRHVLVEIFGLSDSEGLSLVGAASATQGWSLHGRLGRAQTEKAVEALTLLAYAARVIGNIPEASRWIHEELPALNGERPIDLLLAGKLDQVKTVLDRLYYGVYS